MTYAWDSILTHVARRMSDVANTRVESSHLIAPPDPNFGDLTFSCFKIAKEQKKSPADIAKFLAEQLMKVKKDPLIESAVAVGPYLNVTLQHGETVTRIVEEVELKKTEYGTSNEGKKRQLMLEYAQPNTHKEFHVGHLRNLVLGNALARILTHTGWKVVTASYHGDAGAHVAKCLWMLQRKRRGVGSGQQGLEKTGKYLGELYAQATRLLDEKPELKEEVSDVQRKIEAGDKELTKLWKETREWSLVEFNKIFDDLGTRIHRQYFESEVVEDGQKIVDELLKKRIAKKSDGAIVVDLEADRLGVFLIRKSDNTSLYATKDLALAKLKAKEYPKLARSLILVDNRQALYCKQLFRALELMGVKLPHEFVGYEFVTLKSGAMSSREGSIVTYDTFCEEMMKFAREETWKRHPDWADGRVEQTAWAIAMGGIIYGMLKQDADKQIVFDLERALSFDGDTGPYIQYATTRLAAILKKASWNLKRVVPPAEMDLTTASGEKGQNSNASHELGNLRMLVDPVEKRLALQIARFPHVCFRAAQELKPHLIAHWCFAAAKLVNDMYRDVPVLAAPSADLRAARLRLVAAAHTCLTLGLSILGMSIPDEM